MTVKGVTCPACPVKFHGQGADFPAGKQGQENPTCLGSISVRPWSSGCSQGDFGDLGNPAIDPSDSNRLIPESPRPRGTSSVCSGVTGTSRLWVRNSEIALGSLKDPFESWAGAGCAHSGLSSIIPCVLVQCNVFLKMLGVGSAPPQEEKEQNHNERIHGPEQRGGQAG